MLPNHPAFRIASVITVISLVSYIPAVAQSPGQDDALARLAKVAKKREKEVAKQEKAAYELQRAAEDRATEAIHKGGLSVEYSLYRRESLARRLVTESFHRGRNWLQEVIETQRSGPRAKSSLLFYASPSVTEMRRLNEQVDLQEKDARGRLSFAKYMGKDDDAALIERELSIYPQARAALAQEREILDQYLVAAGAPSVSELEQRLDARENARRRSEQQTEEERRRAGEYVAGLILTLGVVAALAMILKSPTATESQKDEAQERLNELKARAKSDCLSRGGDFLDGGAFSVGTCTK